MPYADPEKKRERDRERYQNNKEAVLAQQAKYRQNNKEARAAAAAEYRQTPGGRAAGLASDARHRASDKGIDYTLNTGVIAEVLEGGKCQRTGLPLNLTGGWTWDSASLDRIDNQGGYTPENTRVVLWAYNASINNWGEDVVLKIADALRANSSGVNACLKRSTRGQEEPA
jgi:hypothetical protein